MNDPDEGGMHLPDVFVFRPVFHHDRLLGFAACVAHYPDIGGRTAGGNAVDSTEIFQEGLQIPHPQALRSRPARPFAVRDHRP